MSTTVTSSTGTTYISGTGTSGFDSSALIEAAVEAKMAAAYRIDDQIDVLESEVTGWETVLTDLTAVSDAAEALSASSDDSVWDDHTAYLTSSTISNPDNVVAVTVDDEASLGVYTLTVDQLATSQKVASSEQTSKTDALGLSGSFTLVSGDGTASTITVTESTTLTSLASAINAVSSTTGVTATLMKTSDSGYTLVLASADTGTANAITVTDGDGLLASLGVVDDDGAFANQLQAAQDAIVTIDGTTITSSSNDIEDVMPGVSISLYNTTGDGNSITVEVGQDLDGIADAITALVDAYNTYRTYAILNQTTDSDGAVDDAVLFGDSLLRSINTALYDVLGKSIEVDGTTYTLASFGITYDDDNNLVVDDDTIEEALIQNADVLQAFFEQSVASSSDDLYLATTPGDMPAGDLAVEVTFDDDGNITAASIGGVDLVVSGKTLKGADGTDYEGLRMVCTASATGTTVSYTVSVEEGLADSLVAALDTYAADDGLVQSRIDSLNTSIDKKQTRRDRIAEQADDYETYLTAYYARIEAAMEAAELALKQVEALFFNDDD